MISAVRDVSQERNYRVTEQSTVLWNTTVRNSNLASTMFIDIRKSALYSSPQNSFLNKQKYKSYWLFEKNKNHWHNDYEEPIKSEYKSSIFQVFA